MTRLAVSTDYDLAQNFVEIETKLFAYRLGTMKDAQINVEHQLIDFILSHYFTFEIDLILQDRCCDL
jgi:hypothetical protein